MFTFSIKTMSVFYLILENNPKQIRKLIGLNTELARAVDVMMARTKRIYILMIEVNKLFFFSFVAVFSKRNRKHVFRVPIEL